MKKSNSIKEKLRLARYDKKNLQKGQFVITAVAYFFTSLLFYFWKSLENGESVASWLILLIKHKD